MQRTWIDPGGPELFHKGMEKRFLAGGEIRSPAREMRISSTECQGRTRVPQGRAQRIRFRKIEAKAMQPCIRNQRDGDRFSRGAAQIRQHGKLRKSSQGKYQTGIHRRRKMACRGHTQENDLLIKTGAPKRDSFGCMGYGKGIDVFQSAESFRNLQGAETIGVPLENGDEPGTGADFLLNPAGVFLNSVKVDP